MGRLSERLKSGIFLVAACFALSIGALAQGRIEPKNAASDYGRPPLIVIPGIMGSELIVPETNERVWHAFTRSANEDLRLPIAANLRASRDKLVAGDILRSIDLKLLPDIEVYQGLIDALVRSGGYKEASWTNPPKALDGKIFLFPYDWRRDNVESAQALIGKIERLKRESGNPNAKFNILAHSMGGLIARYAAMYGNQDLPSQRAQPNWAGSKHISRIFFLGTPNEGSAEAFSTLLNGQSSLGGTTKIPFVRYLTPNEISTMPSVFQLLPHRYATRFFDDDLKPINIDLFDLANWKKYGWAIFRNDSGKKEFSEVEFAKFEKYFSIILLRAKQFQAAIDAGGNHREKIDMVFLGSDCRDTLDGIVIRKDVKNRWRTITFAESFHNSKGEYISKERLKKLMFVPGDGSVSRKSLLSEFLATEGKESGAVGAAEESKSSLFVCDNHEWIMNNAALQERILSLITPSTAAKMKTEGNH